MAVEWVRRFTSGTWLHAVLRANSVLWSLCVWCWRWKQDMVNDGFQVGKATMAKNPHTWDLVGEATVARIDTHKMGLTRAAWDQCPFLWLFLWCHEFRLDREPFTNLPEQPEKLVEDPGRVTLMSVTGMRVGRPDCHFTSTLQSCGSSSLVAI